MAIKISIDREQQAAGGYGFGDGHRENIIKGTLEYADFPDQERQIRKLIANYRYDSRAEDYLQKDLSREANEFGVEETVPLPFTHRHEDADRILDYLAGDEVARAVQLAFSGKKVAPAAKNQRYAVTVPSMGISSDWQVSGFRTLQEAYAFQFKRYIESKYDYEPSPELPANESLPELTIFGTTPPFPISNFQVSTYYELKPDQSVEVYVAATWSPPEENYSETRISIRKTGEENWQEAGRGFDRAILSGFVPGTSYDVRGVPYNLAGTTPGLVRIVTAITAGAELTNPTTPVGLAGSAKHGRVIFEWNRHTDPQVMGYHIRFWTLQTGGSMIAPPGQVFVRQPTDPGGKPHYEFQRQRGNLTSILNTWAEVRAIKFNGRLSAFTSRARATTDDIATDDMRDGTVTNPKVGTGAIDRTKIQNLEVVSAKIGNLEVGTIKINDSAVNEAKRIDVFNAVSGQALGNVDANRVIKGSIVVNHGLGRKPMVAIRFSAPSVDASDRLQRMAVLTSVSTASFTIHWEVGNHGGSGTLSAGQGTFEWWYW